MDTQTVIAVVEDDAEIGPLVAGLLRREGFDAELCASGAAFDRLRARRRVDLVVLDLMLPGEDGLSICRRLRAEGEVPVLIVTARGDDIDRIVGLEIGADDYLPKPFNPRELVARIRAILRRTRDRHRVMALPVGERWDVGGFMVDTTTRTLTDPEGIDIPLTGGEFDLLVAFVRHPRRVLSRDQLLDWTRGRDAQPFDRSIDVQVGKLRRKLAAHPKGDVLIKTVRGGGYCLAAPVEQR
ncbi:MAG: response regulator [Pseudomonadota bacterium]|jgi:two-component system OmpR family response regulator